MQSRFLVGAAVSALTLFVAACGGTTAYPVAQSPVASSSSYPAASDPPSASPSAPVKTGTILTVANHSGLGQILVDGKGRTVYLFLADKGTTSVCYDQCATYWPPVLTTGAPQAGAGVNVALLGVTKRRDGTSEVTYAGHPLYYFISDRKPGDASGQAVNGFGAPWYVLAPTGQRIG